MASREYLHTLMRGLVKRHFREKEYRAANEIESFIKGHEIEDGKEDRGGFSRKMHGTREWTMMDVVALQALTGSTRVTDAMTEGHATSEADTLNNLQHASRLIKESGEGVSALMALEDGGCISEARAQIVDILEAANAALAHIDAQPTQLKRRAAS